MAILSTVKKIMPYIKEATGYVLCRISSQAVEMDDGTVLQNKIESMDNEIESMDNEIESMDNEIESMSNKIESMDNEIESMSNEIESMGNEIESMGNEIDEKVSIDTFTSRIGNLGFAAGRIILRGITGETSYPIFTLSEISELFNVSTSSSSNTAVFFANSAYSTSPTIINGSFFSDGAWNASFSSEVTSGPLNLNYLIVRMNLS